MTPFQKTWNHVERKGPFTLDMNWRSSWVGWTNCHWKVFGTNCAIRRRCEWAWKRTSLEFSICMFLVGPHTEDKANKRAPCRLCLLRPSKWKPIEWHRKGSNLSFQTCAFVKKSNALCKSPLSKGFVILTFSRVMHIHHHVQMHVHLVVSLLPNRACIPGECQEYLEHALLLRPHPHRTRRKANGTCWCEWRCPHCTQTISNHTFCRFQFSETFIYLLFFCSVMLYMNIKTFSKPDSNQHAPVLYFTPVHQRSNVEHHCHLVEITLLPPWGQKSAEMVLEDNCSVEVLSWGADNGQKLFVWTNLQIFVILQVDLCWDENGAKGMGSHLEGGYAKAHDLLCGTDQSLDRLRSATPESTYTVRERKISNVGLFRHWSQSCIRELLQKTFFK